MIINWFHLSVLSRFTADFANFTTPLINSVETLLHLPASHLFDTQWSYCFRSGGKGEGCHQGSHCTWDRILLQRRQGILERHMDACILRFLVLFRFHGNQCRWRMAEHWENIWRLLPHAKAISIKDCLCLAGNTCIRKWSLRPIYSKSSRLQWNWRNDPDACAGKKGWQMETHLHECGC